MLYYLEKFCRICIQTGGKLTDIESKDHDSVKFSEKLKTCTQMVITRESLSTQICSSCVHKLRISYQFQNMCKKSTAILQQYLTELLSMSDEITADKFLNSELTISTATLPKPRRKRVGKDERCSLLKKLLSRITQEQIVHNIHINGLSKLCERIPPATADIQTHSPFPIPQKQRIDKPDVEIIPLSKVDKQPLSTQRQKTKSTGLRSLLNFTKEFDFGYDISSVNVHCNNFDLTPLERLAKFTESFFYDHFGDYRETILHVSDGFDFDSSDDEKMFEECNEVSGVCCKKDFFESKVNVKEEIVIVEPDLNLKKEMFYDEEPTYEESDTDATADYDFTSRFVQACYDDSDDLKQNYDGTMKQRRSNKIIKQECENQECEDTTTNEEYEDVIKRESDVRRQSQTTKSNYIAQNSCLAEIIPITSPMFTSQLQQTDPLQHSYLQPSNYPLGMNSPASCNFLTQNSLQSDFIKQFQDSPINFKRHRTLSPYSVKCRTRGNPFINPQLKKQFQMRNFKCSTCNRRFKSPGYLKAHCSKLRH